MMAYGAAKAIVGPQNKLNPFSWLFGARGHRRFIRAHVGKTMIPPAKRGARVPPTFGRLLIDAPIVWVASRRVQRQSFFGKGIGGQSLDVDISFEFGLQILGPGPMSRLFSVIAGGKAIKYFGKAGLSRGDGSPVEVNIRGSESFRVYWGTPDQPPDERVESAFGIKTNLPNVAYVIWDQKRLNQGEAWPSIEFECEFRPEQSALVLSPNYYEDIFIGDGVLHRIYDADQGHFTVRGFQSERFRIGNEVNLVGQPNLSGSFPITATSYRNAAVTRTLVDLDLTVWDRTNVSTVVSVPRFGPNIETHPAFLVTQASNPTNFGVQIESDGGFLAAPPGVRLIQEGEIWIYLPDSFGSVSKFRFSWINPARPSKTAWVEYEWQSPFGLLQYRMSASHNVTFENPPPSVFTALPPEWLSWIRMDIAISSALALDNELREVRIEAVDVTSASSHTFTAWRPRFRETAGTRVDIDRLGGTDPVVSNEGTAEAERVVEYSGCNGAHVLYQLLFARPGNGLGMPPLAFDINSLEAVGVGLGDDVRVNCQPAPSENLSTFVDTLLRDMGVGIFMHPSTGLYTFTLIRNQLDGLELHPRALAVSAPERLTMQPYTLPRRAIFSFVDRRLNYAESTFVTPNDADNPQLVDRDSDDVIEIETATDLEAAARIAARRVSESLYSDSVISFIGQFEARYLTPGTVIRLPGDTETWRVISVQWRQGSPQVEITAIIDAYGQENDIYVPDSAQPSNGVAAPSIDDAFEPYELPRVLRSGAVEVVPLRIRAHEYIRYADIWVGPVGGSALQRLGTSNNNLFGGTLAEVVPGLREGPWVSEEGFVIDVAGPPDWDLALDLSGDPDSWRALAQVAIVLPPAGVDIDEEPISEIMAVRGIEILTERTARVLGVLRARLNTKFREWPIGSRIFIGPMSSLQPVLSHPLMRIDDTLRFRAQPFTSTGLDLSSIPDTTRVLWGKGLRPSRPSSLRIAGSMPPIYRPGLGAQFVWNYSTAQSRLQRTGAGSQGYGVRCGVSPFEGQFIIEFKDPAQPLLAPLRAIDLSSPSYFLPSASIITWAGLEPVEIDVTVYGIIAQRRSEIATLRIQRLDA